MKWFRTAAVAAILCSTCLASWAQHYVQTNLVSDVAGAAQFTDPDLVNAWGMSRSAGSPWWVSDNGTGKTTLYNGSGVKQGLVVTIAAPSGSTEPATPTGQVSNSTSGFVVTNPQTGNSGPARFIFVTEDGTISGWSPAADPSHSIIAVDNSATAIYKGVAMLTTDHGTFLYAANFKQGTIDVFDSQWKPVTMSMGDASLPPGYAPFNVQAIGSSLFVAYAKVGDLPDEQHGKGLGYIDEFDSSGTLVRRFEHGPWLNAPWGMALAPAGFGAFGSAVIVGNFGSGQLVAYDRNSGALLGFLHGARGPLVIDGLWGLAFGGNTLNNGSANSLYFTAGPNDEQHGLFGFLTAAPDDTTDQ